MSRIIPRDLIKHLEWTPGQTLPPPRSTVGGNPNSGGGSPGSTNPSIQSLSDFWSISGIQYRNSVYTVDLMKVLLDGGSTKTQDDWVVLYDNARDQNEFHIPDYPLLYGIVKTLYTLRNRVTQQTEVAEAQKFLKDTFRAKWLMTSTRIKYQPSGDDLIFHNYGTRDVYEERAPFIGINKKVEASDNPQGYQKLLGTNDTSQEVIDVFKWLNDTDMYIYCVTNRLSAVDERVARFGANYAGTVLYCDGYPTNSDSGLGVRLRKKI